MDGEYQFVGEVPGATEAQAARARHEVLHRVVAVLAARADPATNRAVHLLLEGMLRHGADRTDPRSLVLRAAVREMRAEIREAEEAVP